MNTEYKGRVLHMHSYRTNYDFRDKTVLVVGNQNSASDAAADISHVAKQVGLSLSFLLDQGPFCANTGSLCFGVSNLVNSSLALFKWLLACVARAQLPIYENMALTRI